MEGSAKIKLSTFLPSNAYANRFWVVWEFSLEMILAFKWPLEVSWKADVIKYDFREGPKSFDHPAPPEKFSVFGSSGRDQGGSTSLTRFFPFG